MAELFFSPARQVPSSVGVSSQPSAGRGCWAQSLPYPCLFTATRPEHHRSPGEAQVHRELHEEGLGAGTTVSTDRTHLVK